MHQVSKITLTAAFAGLAALGTGPRTAQACGGLFCNASQPVNQAAERIIFAYGEDGSVTAVIEIQYAGPSENFSWVLPVQGQPEVGISSTAALNALQAATNPQYTLNTRVEGSCREDLEGSGSRRFFSPSFSAAAGAEADDGKGVQVLEQGAVGPYDYVNLAVDPSAMDKFKVLSEWLEMNGYDISALAPDTLRPYLESGLNLLAFKLTKGNDAGSVRPVRLSFGRGAPSIPIRPTAVAANDDMGILVWVIADKRVVPMNYRHLELNEALVDWLNPNRNYNDVVTLAANEAGGQGFVTEMAGSSATFEDTVFPSWQAEGWARIKREDWRQREGQLVAEVLSSLIGFDGLADIVQAMVPTPKDISDEEFLSCPRCYLTGEESDIPGFDPATFIAEVQRQVVKPMVETQALITAKPYITRLYTTMSANEMTMDPMFGPNDTLGDFSNLHQADRIIECNADTWRADATWRIELPDGTLVVRGQGSNWPFNVDDTPMPANARVLRVGETGTGDVIEDNAAAIGAALVEHNATVPSGHSGCSVGVGQSPLTAGAVLVLLGLVVGARRRRP